jgi:hypothetical protein
MDLHHPGIPRHDGRDERTLKRPSGHDDVSCSNLAAAYFGVESVCCALMQPDHVYATADGGRDAICEGNKILDHLGMGGKPIRIDARNWHQGEAIVPSRPVGMQAVPSFRTPALSNPMPLHDQMRQSAFAQLLAHRQSGLAAANYERFDILGRHNATLF